MNEKDTKVIMKKVERRGGAHNLHPNFMQENVQSGDNARFLDHEMKVMNMPEIDRGDDKQVQDRIVEYFTLCRDDDMKPTVSGLAGALGVDRTTLWDYKVGNMRVASINTIKKAYNLLERMWEDYMQSGKINPVSGIFLGKNNFNYQDKTEVTLKNGSSNNDPKQIEQEYASEKKALEAPGNEGDGEGGSSSSD